MEARRASSSVHDTMAAINRACTENGGKYAQYRCQVVSWDDVSRGTIGGSLSCWGANITDTYLKSRDGTPLFTVRSANWNEKLGKVTSSDVALVAGDQQRGGEGLQPMTLRSFLRSMGNHGSYAGLDPSLDLSSAALDEECSIRFQTTFIPVSGERGTMEFATEAYNYNTTEDSDPRNLVLLCTSQGVAVQQDGRGAKRLFHHAVDESGQIHRYWLEAESSDHKVGGPQRETADERADALARGKATSSVIGTRAMGTRFNVLMTIQVPLKQKERPQRPAGAAPKPGMGFFGGMGAGGMGAGGMGGGGLFQSWGGGYAEGAPPPPPPMCAAAYSAPPPATYSAPPPAMCAPVMCAPPGAAAPAVQRRSRAAAAPPPPRGRASAARVSRGTEEDVWRGLSIKKPQRNASEHVTVTIVIYNAIADGVPSSDDVMAAIDDLEALYASCSVEGRLADPAFDFMKGELTVKDTADITTKVVTQPYRPPPVAVVNHDVFPS